MSASLNRVNLMGNLGADPEIRSSPDGTTVATFNLATTEVWRDREGNRQERTEWHRIVFYKALADVTRDYLKKGALVYLEGKLRTHYWEDKDGKRRFTTEIAGNLLRMLNKQPSKHPVDGSTLDEEVLEFHSEKN
ncbi:single-strand binding protein [Nitrosospira multiformis]|uniref:Single-stranded DNA-binding protein n=1 Tax=Nitrosospira multiformis TaxID=1231 RepID=A0A2T5I6I2_9PROT|nr:single-stranded DNA-binding protein [Nitrosospira multiformis]PTQ79419.1 single-strand binding protein [Nitrosospira multiformis]